MKASPWRCWSSAPAENPAASGCNRQRRHGPCFEALDAERSDLGAVQQAHDAELGVRPGPAVVEGVDALVLRRVGADGVILAAYINWDLIAMGLAMAGMAAWAARRGVLAGVLLCNEKFWLNLSSPRIV